MPEKSLSEKFSIYAGHIYDGAKEIGSLERKGSLALSSIMFAGGITMLFTTGTIGLLPLAVGATGIASRLSHHGQASAEKKQTPSL
jgi:hypothetical protein